jgi:hypothetical protein
LLVHFSAGGYAVDGEVEEFAGTDDVEDFVDVDEDVFALLFEVFGLADGLTAGVAGRVDEAVHVHVEVVDVGVGGVEFLLADLYGVAKDFRVAHAEPLEEDGHSH